jgi:hypothetical protein
MLTLQQLMQMINVGPFQRAKVMASGGIAPEEVAGWLEAGAMAVGIGAQVQCFACHISLVAAKCDMVHAACGRRHSASGSARELGFGSGGGGLAGRGPSSGRVAFPQPFGIPIETAPLAVHSWADDWFWLLMGRRLVQA